MAGGNKRPGRSVTSKVLAIIGVFETTRRSMTLTEISERAEVPLSTTHRLVGELTDWGLLSYGANGRVQLGLRLWTIAQNVGRQLRETARPFIQELYSLTGETSQLAIRDGDSALYIERVYGTKRVPRASRVGGRLPLHATAVGKVILALEDPWVRTAYLQKPLQQRARRTIIDPTRLKRHLEAVAEAGYATTVEEAREGACSIAVPVFHGQRVGASVGLVLPTSQVQTMNQYLPVLHGVASRIKASTAHIPLETLLGSYVHPLSENPPQL